MPTIPVGLPMGDVRFQVFPKFDTNWKNGSGATPLTTQGLFFGDAISIPIARSINSR
jgi:hypothetical protein